MEIPDMINLGGEEEKEEVQILREEINKLRREVKKQADEIAAVGGQVIKKESGITQVLEKSPTKPRDIPLLELCQLEGIEAAARLQMFIELVEQVSLQDETRVRVAKSRLSPEIAMLVHNKQQHGNLTWTGFCYLLRTQFAVEITVDRAWQDLDAEQYDWADESPQAFYNRFVCKYAVLQTKFPAEHFPNQDRTIKRKIWRGLPRELRERTEGFLEEDYPLEKFMERVGYQRQLWLDGQVPGINKIKTEVGAEKSQINLAEEKDRELEALKQQVASLTQSLSKLQPKDNPPRPQNPTRREINYQPRPKERRWHPSNPPTFCAYCRVNSHTLEQCKKAPGPGLCFDCHRANCRRGKPGCPKGNSNYL